ncbi:hypothetical protein CEXT_412641 [Caerostris extrusa]|uniref:Uncharacterized protein n=1 Tax=Caerostris extrusa TaxID=172846 RepID=A0AAV4P0X3_CAEEX|nr:hypothetical protein CEXT_412641 [Caerostris extrusa]
MAEFHSRNGSGGSIEESNIAREHILMAWRTTEERSSPQKEHLLITTDQKNGSKRKQKSLQREIFFKPAPLKEKIFEYSRSNFLRNFSIESSFLCEESRLNRWRYGIKWYKVLRTKTVGENLPLPGVFGDS